MRWLGNCDAHIDQSTSGGCCCKIYKQYDNHLAINSTTGSKGEERAGESCSWTRSGQLSGIVWRCLCNNTLSDLIWHITADISGLGASFPPSLLHLTAKPLIETNFQYNRTTNNMTDATKSYVVDSLYPLPFCFFCHSLCLPCAKKCHFLWAIICFATLCERSYPIWPSTPFFLLFFALFLLSPSYTPSTSCCFRNFMLLTNLSLSGLLFTQGSPQQGALPPLECV